MKISLAGLCIASLQVITSQAIELNQTEAVLNQLDDTSLIQIESESDSEFLHHLLSMCHGGCNMGGCMGGCHGMINPCQHCKPPPKPYCGSAPQHVHYHIPPCPGPKPAKKPAAKKTTAQKIQEAATAAAHAATAAAKPAAGAAPPAAGAPPPM